MRKQRAMGMDFVGPQATDYDNVRALNAAFLRLLQDRRQARRLLDALPRDLDHRLRSLTTTETEWLSGAPFLLFSFRERDDRYWRNLLRHDGTRDLFAVPLSAADDVGRLVSAGLGFVWQLATRNPFAARLICGASTHWCEQISEHTLFHLLAIAGHRADLIVLRAGEDPDLWNKLLDCGLSAHSDLRSAAHISAMHYLLTRQPHRTAWRSAACVARDPAFKMAEQPKT